MSQQENPRLVTFETDGSETLIIFAGRSERDKRTIYRGRVEGRYGVVPVDELVDDVEDDEKVPANGDLAIEDMQLVGDPVVVPKDGHSMVSMKKATKHIQQMDRKGAYGLLWIPFE